MVGQRWGVPMRDLDNLPPLLVPSPRVIEIGEAIPLDERFAQVARALLESIVGSASSPGNDKRQSLWRGAIRVESAADLSGGPESYELQIRRGPAGTAEATIRHAPRGLIHAASTLCQLSRQYKHTIPSLMIRDWPAFPARGVMLDISRNRVPTMAEFERIIEQLAELKFNHLQLYTEHTFAYQGDWSGGGHERVWRDASPLTAQEIGHLAGICAARGVDLAANQNCFGHLREWLKHPEYAHLAEIEPDGVWKFMHWERRGPFSLCPTNPQSLEFVRGMLGELLRHFPSPLVNIGCDETFDVGFGRSKEIVDSRAAELSRAEKLGMDVARDRARAELFFDFVGQVCGVAHEHGRTPLMWADIALKHPEMLSRLPRNVVGLVWGYEPETDFASGLEALRGAGLPPGWVCPGTSSWRSITGRTTEARENIARAAREGLRCGAAGLLICDWGDVGHMQTWLITLRRLADAAEAAWSGASAHDRLADPRAVSLQCFEDDGLWVGDLIDQLGDADIDVRRSAHANYSPDPDSRGMKNASAIFNDLFPPVPVPDGQRAIEASLEQWERVLETLDQLAAATSSKDSFLIPRPYREELEHTLAFARFAAAHAHAQRFPEPQRRARFHELLAPARDLLEQHKALWKRTSRPGGLKESCSHLERVIAALEGRRGGA